MGFGTIAGAAVKGYQDANNEAWQDELHDQQRKEMQDKQAAVDATKQAIAALNAQHAATVDAAQNTGGAASGATNAQIVQAAQANAGQPQSPIDSTDTTSGTGLPTQNGTPGAAPATGLPTAPQSPNQPAQQGADPSDPQALQTALDKLTQVGQAKGWSDAQIQQGKQLVQQHVANLQNGAPATSLMAGLPQPQSGNTPQEPPQPHPTAPDTSTMSQADQNTLNSHIGADEQVHPNTTTPRELRGSDYGQASVNALFKLGTPAALQMAAQMSPMIQQQRIQEVQQDISGINSDRSLSIPEKLAKTAALIDGSNYIPGKTSLTTNSDGTVTLAHKVPGQAEPFTMTLNGKTPTDALMDLQQKVMSLHSPEAQMAYQNNQNKINEIKQTGAYQQGMLANTATSNKTMQDHYGPGGTYEKVAAANAASQERIEAARAAAQRDQASIYANAQQARGNQGEWDGTKFTDENNNPILYNSALGQFKDAQGNPITGGAIKNVKLQKPTTPLSVSPDGSIIQNGKLYRMDAKGNPQEVVFPGSVQKALEGGLKFSGGKAQTPATGTGLPTTSPSGIGTGLRTSSLDPMEAIAKQTAMSGDTLQNMQGLIGNVAAARNAMAAAAKSGDQNTIQTYQQQLIAARQRLQQAAESSVGTESAKKILSIADGN